jgi:hypothetical protein
MTQAELNRQVARATGETVAEIRHMGFSFADEAEPGFDPEATEYGQQVDWDAIDAERYALLPS